MDDRLVGGTVNQLTGQSIDRFVRIAWLVGNKCWYIHPSMGGAEDIRCETSIRSLETQLESIDLPASTRLNDLFYFAYINLIRSISPRSV